MDLRSASGLPLVEEDYSSEEANVPEMPTPLFRPSERRAEKEERETKREEPEVETSYETDSWDDCSDEGPQSRYVIAETAEQTIAIYAGDVVHDGTSPHVASLDGWDLEDSLEVSGSLFGTQDGQKIEPVGLRESHLVQVASREGEDPEALAGQLEKVWEDLDEARTIVGSGRHQLTNTQTMQLHMHVGSLFSILEKLKSLIERYADDEDLFNSLWAVYSTLDSSVEKYQLRKHASPDASLDLADSDASAVVEQHRMSQFEFSASSRLDRLEGMEGNFTLVNNVEAEPELRLAKHLLFSEAGLEEKLVAAADLEGNGPVLNPEILGCCDGGLEVIVTPVAPHSPSSWNTSVLGTTFTFSPRLPKEVVQYREIRIVRQTGVCDTVFLHFADQERMAKGFFVPPPNVHPPLCFALEDNGEVITYQHKEALKVGDVFGVGSAVKNSEDGAVSVAFFTVNGSVVFAHTVSSPVASSLGLLTRKQGNKVGAVFRLTPPLDEHAYDALAGHEKGVLAPKCCEICYDDYFCFEGKKLGCGHEYCAGCCHNHLNTAIDSGDVLEIMCPYDCGYELTEEEMELFLPVPAFAKLKQFRFLTRLRLEPDCRFCPTVDCGGGEIADRDHPDFPMLTCSRCHRAFCFDCGHVWHPQRTCRQSERDRQRQQSSAHKKAEKDTAKALREMKTIKCLKCGALVQKLSGCNHMECRCGYEFCWLCGETIITAVGSSSYPLHYKTGACAGMQMSSANELPLSRKVARTVVTPVKYGAMGLVAAGAVVGGVVALGIAVPVAGVALPVYGGYRLAKTHKRRRREKKLAEAKSAVEVEAWYASPWLATHDGYGSSDSDYEEP